MGSIFFLTGFLLVLGFVGLAVEIADKATDGALTDYLMKWMKVDD